MAETSDDHTNMPIFRFLHKNRMSIKECYLLMEFVLKLLFFCTCGLTCIFGVIILWQFSIFENNTVGFSVMSFLWLAICAMMGFIVHVIVIYFESKTDHLCSLSDKSTASLQEKFEQLSEKLERILENQLSNQQPKENAVFRTVRHLSVKSYNRATHSSETRTPSALDMSPIVSESTFNNLADNSNPYQSDLQPLCLKVDAADEDYENDQQHKKVTADQDSNMGIAAKNVVDQNISAETTLDANVELQKGVAMANENDHRNEILTDNSDDVLQGSRAVTADIFQSTKAAVTEHDVRQKPQEKTACAENLIVFEAGAKADLDAIHKAAIAAYSENASRDLMGMIAHQDNQQICEGASDDTDILMSSDAAQESLGL